MYTNKYLSIINNLFNKTVNIADRNQKIQKLKIFII